MSNLVFEILLRLAKAGVAALLGVLLFASLIGPLGAAPTVELALLCWLSGAAFILLVETAHLSSLVRRLDRRRPV